LIEAGENAVQGGFRFAEDEEVQHPALPRKGCRLPLPRTGTHHVTLKHSQQGFTLIEVLVAILVLSVGILGVATLAIQASAVTADTKAREGGTNLAREAIETILSLPYSSATPDSITDALQAKAALAPASGYPGWTVLRREIPYTVSVTGCYVDDPADARGAHDASFCSGSTAGATDSNPIDYKRFSVNVAWTRNQTTRSVTQTTLVSPKGTREVPAVTSLTSASGITITDPSLTSLNFSAGTSSSATGVAWSVDQGVRGQASGGGKSWSFSWDISSVPDGQYVIGAKAYNSAGAYGTPLSLTITVNRAPPSAPRDFVAGWNQSVGTVDSEWLASPELDTVGYTVYRQQTAPSLGSVTKVNCGTPASPLYIVADTKCSDASPLASGSSTPISVNYWVVGVDRDPAGAYREGPASNAVNAYAPNVAPDPITSALTCTTNGDGSVTLSWTQPSQPGDPDSGDRIAFDRIYRDDVRFDRTGLATDDSFTDPNPAGVHDYYVDTVDTHLAESTATGTVSC